MTTAFSALAPVSQGINTVLNVSAITTLAQFGAAIPQAATFPFLLFEVNETYDGALGTKPGVDALYQVDLTLHAYAEDGSSGGGVAQAQALINVAIGLLADAPAVPGFSSWAIFHDGSQIVGDELVAGVKVKEVVSKHRLYVELAS